MKKHWSLAALVLGAGLVSAAPAHAVTVSATAMNPLSSGTYSVTVNRTSNNTFQVAVAGNNDGRTTASGTMEPEKHSVGRVSVSFLRTNGTYIGVNEGATSGGTTSGAGYIGAAWAVTPLAEGARFNAPELINDVAAFGGNQFNGTVTLDSNESIGAITVALQNGTQQWWVALNEQDIRDLGDITPEPASLALALPGLMPLAFALRRKRNARQPQEAQPTA